MENLLKHDRHEIKKTKTDPIQGGPENSQTWSKQRKNTKTYSSLMSDQFIR